MYVIILIFIISGIIALLFAGFYYWNVSSGQYDDTYSPPNRILFDDLENKNKQTNIYEQ